MASVECVLTLSLLLLFSFAIASALRRKLHTSCNCFGPAEQPISFADLWRTVGFLCYALGGDGCSSGRLVLMVVWTARTVALRRGSGSLCADLDATQRNHASVSRHVKRKLFLNQSQERIEKDTHLQEMLVVSSVLLWIVVLLNLLLTLALIRRINTLLQGGKSMQAGGLKAGEVAPSFTAQNLQEATVEMANYSGHPVLFVFVAPHCAPCHQLLPELNDLYPGAKRAGVEMVCVSGGDLESTRQMAQQLHIVLPIVVAPQDSNSFYRDYSVRGTPTYCFIDAQGIVVSSGYPGRQQKDWQTLTNAWSKAEKAPTV